MELMHDCRNWIYRGEGNSSLVVANLKEKKVLRLRKCFTDSKVEKQEANRRDWLLCKDYIDNIMRPLLGEKFVSSPELVTLSAEFIAAVNRECLQIRPKKRLNAHADSDILLGMVLPDACFIDHPIKSSLSPTYCVEIKCKQGFFPPYSIARSLPKKATCRFCMLQLLKVTKGSLNHISKFCPLDIFSGNLDQMKHAFRMLLQTPQNNLKIFKDGVLVFSSHDGNPSSLPVLQNLSYQLHPLVDEVSTPPEMKSIEDCIQSAGVNHLIDIVCQALLHVESTKNTVKDDSFMPERCAASTYHHSEGSDSSSLPVGCVLHSVLTAQHLDTSGVYSIHKDFQQLREYIESIPQHREHLFLDGPYPPNYLSFGTEYSFIPSDIVGCLKRIRGFLVAGTSKDLSIMIAVQRLPSNVSCNSLKNVVRVCDNQFQHSVKIVDLDPKPSSRIPKYIVLEDEIWQNYNKHLSLSVT